MENSAIVMMFVLACSVVTQAATIAFTYSQHPTILLLVNEKIYSSIELNLAIFEQDLRAEGYDVANATIHDGASPPEVKNTIKSYYLSSDLRGAILIGNISAAYSEMHTGDFSNPNALKIWIALDATDMYYMDMDGQWEQVANPDIPGNIPSNVVECNLYDSCNTFRNQCIVYPDYQERWDYSQITNKEQYKAEIWISRIMAYNLMEGPSDIGWKNERAIDSNETGISPILTVFSPSFSGVNVSINGVVFPGTPGTTITRIFWDWGDGKSEDHWFSSSHTYATLGQYTIKVTAYQSDGLNATESNRISLSIPKTETQIVNDYLTRDHDYRRGTTQVASKAYLLNSGTGYNDQDMNYSAIFNSIVQRENVTRNDFMTYVGNPEGSELTYLTAHSLPQVHALYDGDITMDDLQNMNKTSIVYILNACSACRWDQYVSYPDNPNYLGGLYVFDTSSDHNDYGLCAIGFSGVGGFNNLKYFTDYLNSYPDSNYAEAYKYWFNENLMINFGPNNYVILGDPTLRPSASGPDVAMIGVSSSKTVVGQTHNCSLNVIVKNEGDSTENITVTAYANTTVIGTQTVNNIHNGTFTVLNFTWSTAGFACGNYTISAYALAVLNETYVSDSTLVGGLVVVSIPGDVDGDGIINILDAIVLGNAFLATPGSSNWNPNTDINGDDIVNILDAIILANNFLARASV